MNKIYPCVEVDLKKIQHNVKTIIDMCNKKHIVVAAVTKVFCANDPIAKAMLIAGVKGFADARISNLNKLKDLDCNKLMIRIPMISEAVEVVKYSDTSLNSEIATIMALSHAAKELNIQVPVVVRLQGTNGDIGKKLLADSGLKLTPCDEMDDAAQTIVNAILAKPAQDKLSLVKGGV